MGGLTRAPEDIKKGLKYLKARTIKEKIEAAQGDMYYEYAEDVADDALAYIEQLETVLRTEYCEEADYDCIKLGKARKRIQQLEAQAPKWISVDDRLPEDNVDVVVYAYNPSESTIAITSYTHNMYGYNIESWRTPWQYFFCDRKITHWMPLPEPPKEADA